MQNLYVCTYKDRKIKNKKSALRSLKLEKLRKIISNWAVFVNFSLIGKFLVLSSIRFCGALIKSVGSLCPLRSTFVWVYFRCFFLNRCVFVYIPPWIDHLRGQIWLYTFDEQPMLNFNALHSLALLLMCPNWQLLTLLSKKDFHKITPYPWQHTN